LKTAERMTAFKPGQSPPLVRIPIAMPPSSLMLGAQLSIEGAP
jgi:hypothetical protein